TVTSLSIVPCADRTVPDRTGRRGTWITAVSPGPRVGGWGTQVDAYGDAGGGTTVTSYRRGVRPTPGMRDRLAFPSPVVVPLWQKRVTPRGGGVDVSGSRIVVARTDAPVRGAFVSLPRTMKTTDVSIGAWYAGRMTVPTFAFGPLSIIEVKVNQGSVPDTGASSI